MPLAVKQPAHPAAGCAQAGRCSRTFPETSNPLYTNDLHDLRLRPTPHFRDDSPGSRSARPYRSFT